MPALNGTGPQGQGPMTGRGLGNCGPGYRGFGRGFGSGLGRGFGRGWGYSDKDEKEALTEEIKGLKEEAKAMENRLEELKTKK